MNVETLLTLGLTVALLVAAFVLRMLILGALRLALRLAGKDTSWTRPLVVGSASTSGSAEAPAPIRRRRPLWSPGTSAALRTKADGIVAALGSRAHGGETARPTRTAHSSGGGGSALGAVGATVLAMTATAWTGLVRGADSLERWADRTSESLQPAMRDITSAARRSTRDIGKYIVAAIATVQHVVLLLAGWVRRKWAEKGPTAEASTRSRVEPTAAIDLDKEDDPLGSSVSTRSRISV